MAEVFTMKQSTKVTKERCIVMRMEDEFMECILSYEIYYVMYDCVTESYPDWTAYWTSSIAKRLGYLYIELFLFKVWRL